MYSRCYQARKSVRTHGGRTNLLPRFRRFPVSAAVVIQAAEVHHIETQSSAGSCWAAMTATSNAQCDSVLAVLESVDADSSAMLVEFVTKTPHIRGCYAYLRGADCPSSSSSSPHEAGSSPITVAEVNALACLLDAFAVSDQPRMHCVPLLRAAGWTPEHIASLPPVRVLLLLLLRVRLPGGLALHSGRSEQSGAESPRPSAAAAVAAAGDGSGEAAAEAEAVALSHGDGDGGGDGGSERRRTAEAIGAELERLRPGCLPRWETRTVEVPGAAAAAGGSGGDGDVSGDVGGPTSLSSSSTSSSISGHVPSPGSVAAALPSRGDDRSSAPAPSSHASGGEPHQQHQPSAPSAAPSTSPSPLPSSASRGARYVTLVDGSTAAPETRLRFGRVAVGGTFDRLHAGHELLLAVTALLAEGFVFVGVTADALLANKSHRELLQPYETRAREAVSYMQAVRPGLQVEAGPLCDPKAPTLAELDPAMEALVVSVETLPGAAAINAGRAARGFRPLTIITVPVIGLRGGGGGGGPAGTGAGCAGGGAGGGFSNKLSSSGLRALEAAAAAAGSGGGGSA
ncbi:hypothetical protein PLESTM_001416700 [Pleodorina starrii]|nr:hypothetical protein PLESTM_001416700 [Pleodorina starrii]